tara:strand:+ start:151 stop:615 length:465 start_codon:yes stop_codon:yes gene_type:complete
MIETFFNYFLNPIFFYYDIFYEYFYKEKEEKIENDFDNYYDIENDKIIINYYNNEGEKYKLIINRNNENNLKEKIEKLKNIKNQEDLIVNGTFNDVDITKKLLSIIGPNGEHNLLYKIKVKDILNNFEKNNFNSFELMDNMCDIRSLNLEDYIL